MSACMNQYPSIHRSKNEEMMMDDGGGSKTQRGHMLLL